MTPQESPPLQADARGGLLEGGGELGALLRAMDWSRTSLGPVESWPQALRTSVRTLLTSRQPMFVWWGDELIKLYNDVYAGNRQRGRGDPLPVLQAEPVHLQQIFQNLVSNAIKYRGSLPPRVHIGAVHQIGVAREGRVWLFSVQDNGIGIEPRYKDQVFGLFKRLHSGSRYSGSGSTFFFSIPQSEPA
jgi:signal transduction histidine kinase